jgi:hypothetical protein
MSAAEDVVFNILDVHRFGVDVLVSSLCAFGLFVELGSMHSFCIRMRSGFGAECVVSATRMDRGQSSRDSIAVCSAMRTAMLIHSSSNARALLAAFARASTVLLKQALAMCVRLA